ncbi:MAG: beta-lactamase family protein [Acidobacteria bacterium]|nr:beta-lactamase family protein [Acidobacteriota bacterium]
MSGIRIQSYSLIAVLLFCVSAVRLPAQNVEFAEPVDVGLSSERLARLDRAMQAYIDQEKLAGIVVLVARHGSIVHHKAFGMADIESGKKMKTDHLVRMYSMTKPITSAALLMLYEEGKFQLTDPLEKYIPAFRGVKVFAGLDEDGRMKYEEPRRKITIQDVFRHTAGFGYGGSDDSPVNKAYREAGIDFQTMDSLKELIDKLATVPLLYHPGEQWVYSVAHDVQAYLVEYFSGMPFDKYVQTKIFQPLGMKDAVFGIPKGYAARYTTCYGPSDDGGLRAIDKPESSNYARYTEHPFGGLSLSCTAMDYYLFSQMLLNGGVLEEAQLLGRKTVELMTSNNLPPEIPDLGSMFPGTGYGLGVSVLLDPAQSGNLGSVGQFGWGGAATTHVVIDPEEDMVSIFITQLMPGNMDPINQFKTLVYQSVIE